MERRELYEPEDIEQLLIERPYDELLEEERAFVLRHLSGRDEYEAMRALLLKVHDDDDAAAPIDADPSVRLHVMDVFRREQRPQWRIWLNSVHAFLLPREASAMWRPALALGSVALMIFFVANRGMHADPAEQLAEVKEVPKAATDAGNQAAPAPSTGEPAPLLETRADQPATGSDELPREEKAPLTAATANEGAAVREMAVSVDNLEKAEEPSLAEVAEDLPATATTKFIPAPAVDAHASGTITLTSPGTFSLDSTTLATNPSHVVTGNELFFNSSAADMAPAASPESIVISAKHTGKLEKKQKSGSRKRDLSSWSKDAGEVTADVGPYMDLLRAAW